MHHVFLAVAMPQPGDVNQYRSALLPHQARQFRLHLERPLPPEIELIATPLTLERALPKRQRQFRAGRYCAMKAMEALDPCFAGQQVGRAAGGAPLWPQGLTGSITHTDDFVSAAVASTTDAVALGIDTERIMSESQARDVGRMVAWPAEVAHARAAGMTRLEALTLVFSAKESIFKSLHPMVGQYFDFRDVRIVGIDAQAHTFTARIVRTLSERFPAQTMLQGRFEVELPWVHTGIALQPGHDEWNHHRNTRDPVDDLPGYRVYGRQITGDRETCFQDRPGRPYRESFTRDGDGT